MSINPSINHHLDVELEISRGHVPGDEGLDDVDGHQLVAHVPGTGDAVRLSGRNLSIQVPGMLSSSSSMSPPSIIKVSMAVINRSQQLAIF